MRFLLAKLISGLFTLIQRLPPPYQAGLIAQIVLLAFATAWLFGMYYFGIHQGPVV